jgi:hypothetical protein
MSFAEEVWTVFFLCVLMRAMLMLSRMNRQHSDLKKIGEELTDAEETWLRQDIWDWRWQSVFAFGCLLAGIVALIWPGETPEEVDETIPEQVTLVILLTTAFIAVVRGEHLAYFYRRRNELIWPTTRAWRVLVRAIGQLRRLDERTQRQEAREELRDVTEDEERAAAKAERALAQEEREQANNDREESEVDRDQARPHRGVSEEEK